MLAKIISICGPMEINEYFIECKIDNKVEKINDVNQLTYYKLKNGTFSIIKEKEIDKEYILQLLNISYSNTESLENAIRSSIFNQYGSEIIFESKDINKGEFKVRPMNEEYFCLDNYEYEEMVQKFKLLEEIKMIQRNIDSMEAREK